MAVVLIQDYIFTIVVSTLSGVDQLLSLTNSYSTLWVIRFLIGAGLAAITWYLTIRGRGESARVTFTMLGVFVMLTIVMMIGLFIAKGHGIAAFPYTQTKASSIPLDGCLPYADGLHEGTGCPERSGSHVERHPVRHQRRCRDREMGQEETAATERPLGILQRQIRHRPHGADLLPVLWRDHHRFPGLFCHSLQCLRWRRRTIPGRQPGFPWI